MNFIRRKIYDVIVIGSGAAGGFMAKELTAAGAETLLLEAGRRGRLEDLYIHEMPYELPKRGSGLHKQSSLYPDNISSEIEYQTAGNVHVDRIRTLGGRTFHWNAACLRFSAEDFREHSVKGVEADWPITYQELAPFYDYVEREMHVFGTREGLSVLPDGNFVAEAPRLRCSERIAQKRIAKLGMKLIPARKAVLLRGRGQRGACHYCGHCMDVCDVRAVWSSDVTVIPEAMSTGKLTLRLNALARRILVDKDGRASGVSVIDRVTGKEEEVYARLLVLSCAAIESARLLLNSKSGQYPNGLANSNDLVGRYLTGHTNSTMVGYLKDLVGAEIPPGEGVTDHAYIPRSDRIVNGRRPSYFGGFGMQLNYFNWRWPHHSKSVAGFGSGYKKRVRELQPAMFQMGAFGKVEARAGNRITVDPRKTDKFGIPIPVIKFEFSENDRAIFNDMRSAMSEILDACGTELKMTGDSNVSGFASHEVGTCRMGDDPKQSVLNSYCQAHEVRNLFVVDGSCFTTFPEKNPTLTIAALAVRSARYIARQKSRGEL